MDNLIIVGCGDHFRTNVGPTLASLESLGQARVLATVDIDPLSEQPSFLKAPIPHIVRKNGEQLSRLLRKFAETNPVVVLAHSHDRHAPDALDLLSDGFRVILEKPYALRASDLSLLKDSVRNAPRRLALAEYYLMMKSAPLLHAAGLVRSDSFYVREPGFLEGVAEKSPPLENLVGMLELIGRPRMVYVDVLEGEGLTGRFEYRGRQFADSRSGIGVIMDLAIHALAPVVALEGLLGSLPPSGSVFLGTAVCDTFLRFAETSYEVPAQFVPETYAELSFTTSLGIPVISTVGKYVLRNENQRRLLIVGDEGEALLDMSNCTLSVARTDKCPSVVLRSPKRAETKYLAVFRACLATLAGDTPYNFSASDVAIRANEFALELHTRSGEQGPNRRQYLSGAAPGGILQVPSNFTIQQDPPVPTLDHAGAKLYYEHHYERVAAVEEHGFKMSSGVLVLTAAVFTFASRVGSESFLPWKIAVLLMGIANIAAVFYMWRVKVTIKGHQARAKAVLERTWPDLYKLDRNLPIKRDEWQMRSLILSFLHVCVVVAAILVLFYPPQTRTQAIAQPSAGQQPANQQNTPSGVQPVAQPPTQRKP